MKKNFLLKLGIIILAIILIILGIILFCPKNNKISLIENIRDRIAKVGENLQTANGVTIVDVTDLEDNGNLDHEHIYKTQYDETKHWEECTVCGERLNEKTHSYTSSWTLGTPNDCNVRNVQRKVCACGYNFETTEGKKQHSMYTTNSNSTFVLYQQCRDCGNFPIQIHECYKSNGTRINCSNLGQCNICKYNYTSNNATHTRYIGKNTVNSNFYCQVCNTYIGKLNSFEIVKESNNVYKCYSSVEVPNNAQYVNDYCVGYWGNNVTIQNTLSRNGTTWNNTATITFNGHNESKGSGEINNAFSINGIRYAYLITIPICIDEESPVINKITMGDNEELTEWSKTKPIIVSGTENYCNTVTVKITNEKGEVIFDGGGDVVNNNYQIQCIPEVECDTNGKTFIATVTDNCGNSTQKEFTISKVDAIPPTPTSGTEILGDWAKSKDFTFTATDYGIGQVAIAFNDIEDMKLARVDEHTYSRDYTFTGDVYRPKELSVMYKDGLGNTSIQKITIDKLDNTAPTITNASIHNNKLTITSHDRHETLGEGSGVVKYRYLASEEKLANPELNSSNSIEVNKNDEITVADVYKVKYIYAVAEDYVGNVSEVYEFQVPQLILTSTVNLNTADGKGEVILDWSTYDVTDKYFVVYRKQDNQADWETIVPLTQKLTGNTYTDRLGNDKTKPDVPNITIGGNATNNNINVTANSTDNGTNYKYYIEAYDSAETLLSKSN